jgi:glycosyltransferase involved in cell wall biosynthesis
MIQANTSNYPRITVVMPSLNQANYLEEAITSVFEQDYPNLEFIILDGGSTDGSREIITRYSDRLAYWHCRPDGGQSAAIDHGMSLATGELAGWLNSDDVLLPGALLCIAKACVKNPTGGLFGGNLSFMNQDGIISGFLRMPSNAAWFARHGVFAVGGPGSFYRTQVYRALGGIRHDLHYVMDNELYMRMMLRGVRFVYIDRYLAVFRRYAGQKTTVARDRAKAEEHKLSTELQTHGITYRSAQSLFLYYTWQAVNGNYLQKRLHALRARDKHWRAWARQAFNAPARGR